MNNLMELKAIWLESPLMVETEDGNLESKVRITKGMHVYINHSTLLDCSEERKANYTVLNCFGDIYSTQLEMELINNQGEILKLILK